MIAPSRDREAPRTTQPHTSKYAHRLKRKKRLFSLPHHQLNFDALVPGKTELLYQHSKMAPARLSSSTDRQRAPSHFDDTTIAASSSRSSNCPKCHSERPPSWENRLDPKFNLDQPLHGWPELARAIETYADFEAFPAFRDLNIKSLLYYQCELTALRKKLHEQEWEDHLSQSGDAPKFNSRVDFLLLSEPPPQSQPQPQGNADDYEEEEDDENHEQMELINKIRIVLEKYS